MTSPTADPDLKEATATGAPVRRRMVPIAGVNAPDDLASGDLAVLERSSIGRRTLTRLADELAARGAAGLVVSEALLKGCSDEDRAAIAERLPLLVLGNGGAAQLLGEDVTVASEPDVVLRSILRGRMVTGPLPPHLESGTPMRAIALLAHPDNGGQLPLAKLEEIVAAEALVRDPRSHALTIDEIVIALTGDYDFSEDDGIAEALAHRGKTALLIGNITVGVGRPYAGVGGLRRTYREAVWAARAAEALEHGNRVVTFRELGIYGMLEPFVADPSTADTEDVERLLDYDRVNHTALLPTLEAYFEAGASGDAAQSLFVHRNTVSYRLRAVKRVTGLDVRDPDARLLLEVQIRLARIRGLLPTKSDLPRRSKRGRK